jgi:hypothetical protein
MESVTETRELIARAFEDFSAEVRLLNEVLAGTYSPVELERLLTKYDIELSDDNEGVVNEWLEYLLDYPMITVFTSNHDDVIVEIDVDFNDCRVVVVCDSRKPEIARVTVSRGDVSDTWTIESVLDFVSWLLRPEF